MKKDERKIKRALPVPEPKKDERYEEEERSEGEEEEGSEGSTDDFINDEDVSDSGSGGSDSESSGPVDREDAQSTSSAVRSRAVILKKRRATRPSTKPKKTEARPEKASKRRKIEPEPRKEKKTEDAANKDAAANEKGEKNHPLSSQASIDVDKKTVEDEKKSKRPLFNDNNVDLNLYSSAPENVVVRKVKISNNVLVTCKMVEQRDGKSLGYDFAAITFQRKTQNDGMFEFVLPLSLTPRIIEAMEYIMKDNKKFFNQGMINKE